MPNISFDLVSSIFFKYFALIFIILYAYSLIKRNAWGFLDFSKYAAIVSLLFTMIIILTGGAKPIEDSVNDTQEVMALIKKHKHPNEMGALYFLLIENPIDGAKKAREIMSLCDTDPQLAKKEITAIQKRQKKAGLQ